MHIQTISPPQAWARVQREAARVIDVRDADEQLQGVVPSAWRIPLAALPQHPGLAALPRDQPILLVCASGVRSQAAAATLLGLGFGNVMSVEGGMRAWQAAHLPVDADAAQQAWADRYSRQIRLPEIGISGQRRLDDARVLLVGAGGLGSPIALYLAAAGIGHIRLVDDDRVERSNLQRQVLHNQARIGTHKVQSALHTLRALNPTINVDAHALRLDASNVAALLDGIDVAVDGSDNLATRYLLNRACVERRVPMVYGAVQGFEGQVSVFHPAAGDGLPCYQCLFPEQLDNTGLLNCTEAGVLGVVPGTVGLLQANETMKLLLGIGLPLTGTLLQIDLLRSDFRRLRVSADPACMVCGDRSG